MHLLIGQMLSLLVGLVGGIILGGLIYAWHIERKNRIKLRVPERWPLVSRLLVNSTEEKVWIWLRETFHDHQVQVKIPVLRFTALAEKEKEKEKTKASARLENESLLERLGGVYTTFTISTPTGKVVGCVDVPGKVVAPKSTRELKETLLSDCGIAYIVVNPASLPTGGAMRAAFLGEVADIMDESEETRAGSTNFHADMKAFTIKEVKPKEPPPKKPTYIL
jgi:hypothetical protein